MYSTNDLVVQFKTHILCLLEYSNAAIYHASSSHLESLDSLQTCFLRDIGLPVEDAFLNFHMAPLKLRRDIGVLGLLHKIQLGEAHPDFSRLLVTKVGSFIANTRHGHRRHSRQFEEVAGNSFLFHPLIIWSCSNLQHPARACHQCYKCSRFSAAPDDRGKAQVSDQRWKLG